MTLDVTKISSQIDEMVIKIKSGNRERQEHLQCAVDKLCDKNNNVEKLKRKIEASKRKTTWLVAGLYEGLCGHHQVPHVPPDYTVIATDGSHIDVDRNKSARCFVINIGAVTLGYGSNFKANLESYPRLYCDDNEMVIKDENPPGNERAIDSDLLGIKRGVEECKKLAELASESPINSPTLTLLDGTLILWGLEGYPDFVTNLLLQKGFITYLDKIRDINRNRQMPLASYISLPRTTEVVNSLRVAICPQDIADCDRCLELNGKPACNAVDGVQDYTLFSMILGPDERSDLFYSNSKILDKYPVHNKIHFFYLRVEDEIARVEVPEWVAMKKDSLDLTHALILDQCRRGQGYPVALSEAHEKAVVTGADREEFWGLVEEAMEEKKLPTSTSTKSRSKRTRWI